MVASNKDIPSSLWYSTNSTGYEVGGGRDVLILAPDLSLPHPEAVPRRPGQLTQEDRLKLQSQGLPPDCQCELDIVKGRYELDSNLMITEIMFRHLLTKKQVTQHIEQLLNTTQNDGGKKINCCQWQQDFIYAYILQFYQYSCTILYWIW